MSMFALEDVFKEFTWQEGPSRFLVTILTYLLLPRLLLDHLDHNQDVESRVCSKSGVDLGVLKHELILRSGINSTSLFDRKEFGLGYRVPFCPGLQLEG